MNHSLVKEKLKNFNLEYRHPSYDLELKLTSEMMLCLFKDAHNTLNRINQLEQPVYSTNPLRSKKISLIAWCSVFTKTSIQANIAYEQIFDLRNSQINYIDNETDRNKLIDYEFQLVNDYIHLISQSKTFQYSYPVSNIILTIYKHGTEKLTVASIANKYNLTPDHIGRLFKETVGIPLSTFIQYHKLDIAKNYLIYRNLTINEISTKLHLCNSSNFSKMFKRYTTLNPLEYRHLNIR